MGSREGVLPSIQSFPPLDIDQIARDLRVEARGRASGEHDQPAADSDLPDTAEGDIREEIQRRAREAHEDLLSQLDLYDGRIRRARISTDQRAMIEAAGEGALADFKVQTGDDLDHLHNARREVEGRSRELDAFRTAHQLSRLPRSVGRGEWFVRWLAIAIIVALESILNGTFFAKGSETGLIGGVTQALALSFLNVGGAVACAKFGLPLLVHVRLTVKVVGVLVTLAYVAWLVGWNLFIGHFRDLFVENEGAVVVSDLLARLVGAPFSFSDGESLLLVALGMGLSLMSLIDAAGMDDTYFGYGALGRRRAEAVSAYADQKTSCLHALTLRRDAAIDDMSSVIQFMAAAKFDLDLALSGRGRIWEAYRAYLLHLSDSHARLAQRYREANIIARTTPAPARFQRAPDPLPDVYAASQRSESADLSGDSRVEVVARMEHFIKLVNEQFEAAVRQHEPVASLTAETPHAAP